MADHHGRPLTPVQRSSSQAGQTSGTPQVGTARRIGNYDVAQFFADVTDPDPKS